MEIEIPCQCLETNELNETQRNILLQTGFYTAIEPGHYFLLLLLK